MANLNVSNRMVQVLGNQDAQKLVNKILNDGKVDKTDKQDLQALEAMLKSAAEKDGTLDGEEKELIGALTNHSYVLGVNTGTSEDILLDNLRKVQQIQSKFKDMQPSEVAFDGLAITTDGFFSDEVRVVRLRDQVEAPTSQGSETPQTPTETQTGSTTGSPTIPSENTGEGETVNQAPDTADTPPAEEIDPIVPKTQYTPTTAPTAGTPRVEVASEQATLVEPQAQAYTEAVQELQTEVRAVREMLNDPGQVSNEQLQSSLQSFAESDPTKALTELKRHNENILEDIKNAGLITDADINTLESSSSLTNLKLASGQKFGDVLAQYLKDTPLSDQQLNGYRETLVKAADNYIADPSNANKSTLRTELYDNLYVFEKGATPAQEETYRRLSPALDQVDQKQAAFEQQAGVASGESSVLSPQITSATELAKALANLNSTPQNQIEAFVGQMDKVLTYLDENPNQYEGQTEDVATLRSKLAELKSSQDPERKLALFNELKTDLDEIYIKTDIQKGADGVSQTETLAQLENLKATTSDPNVRQAADFLMQNPELLTNVPKVSEYKTILDSLNNGPQQLTPKQEELKAALESGDTAKVNQMYMSEMFDNMGGFMSSLGGMFGWGMSTPATPETQEPPLPGTWLGAADLADTLNAASPERRAALMTALRSPEAAQLGQTLQNSPELAQIMGRYDNAQAAKNSIEQAHWSSNSQLEQTQEALQNQQNKPNAMQAELSNASTAIGDALANGDLAPVVKEKLTAQKAAIDKALALMEQGKFDEAAASAPDMAPLNDALAAISTNTTEPLLPVGLVLQREASIKALSEVATPSNMAKLQEALKDNPNYAHIFAKEGENYTFPGELSQLLQSDDLSPEALALLLNQSNRAIEVIDSATTRDVDNLRANYDKGKELESQDGVQRDFYSGYMALESLNTIAQTSKSRSNLSQSDILNNIAEQQDVSAILSDTDRGSRRGALTEAMRSENIEKGTTEARQERLTNYIEQAQEFEKTSSGMLLNSIFSNPGSEGRALVNEQLAKIKPPVDSSLINSKEDLFRLLDANQIQQLQDNIANAPYSPERQNLETTRKKLLEAIPKMQPPLDPPYVEGRNYDTSNMDPTDSRKQVLDELNSLNTRFKEVSTQRDLIKDVFAQEKTQELFQAGQALNDVSQDLRTDMGRSLDLLDQEIAATSPAAQEYLRNSNLPPRPQLTPGSNQADYEREVSQYIQAVQQQLSNYQSTAPQDEQAALERISQRAAQINTLSEASSTINSGRVSTVGSADIGRFTTAMALQVVTTAADNAETATHDAETFIETPQNRQQIDQAVPGGSAQIEALLSGPITPDQVRNFETNFAALRTANPELYQNILLRVQTKAYADSNFAEVSDATQGRGTPGAGNRMAFSQVVSAGSSAVTDMQPRPTSEALFAWNQIVSQYGPAAQNGHLDEAAFLRAVENFQSQYGITNPALTAAVSGFSGNATQLDGLSAQMSTLPSHERDMVIGVVDTRNKGLLASRAAIGSPVSGPEASAQTQTGSPPSDPDFQANLARVTQQYNETSTAELFGGATSATIAVNENLGSVYEEAERTGDFSLADRMRAATSQSYQNILENQDETFQSLSSATGIPYTPVSNEHRAASGLSVGAAIGGTAADQKAAELVGKANALADRLVLAPEGENSEEFLMDLINGFIDTIRDQDYKTRQLILAQLANQMMTDSITNFYKDKTDKNNKYHQDSISRMAESFQRNIQRTIQESLVSQASDSQSIAAVSGQVGAANTAEAMGIEQLRASSEQLLSEAQKMTPPLITDLQKEKILESLFDNDPNNDAMGIIALAGLSVN